MAVQQVEFQVTTYSQQIAEWNQQPQVPQITINSKPFPNPGNKPYTASGWQLVVIDPAADLTQPSSVLSNLYFPIPMDGNAWGDWEGTYEQIAEQLLLTGNPSQQIVIAASYGLDENLPPTYVLLQQLLNYGAGSQLQGWVNAAVDAGSESGYWTGTPNNYILIGASGLSFNGGEEIWEVGTSQPITSAATASFANTGALVV